MSKQSLFLEKAHIIHGDRYDYSLVDYQGSKKKVVIICKIHGEFSQTPDNHVSGKANCPVCAKLTQWIAITDTTESFIAKSKIKHGDRYDYSKSIYQGMRQPVEIICQEHGSFMQLPQHHYLSGCGCSKCGYERNSNKFKGNTGDFIEKSTLIHGDTYDYSKSDYSRSCDKITITCKIHGDFYQIPPDHLNGHGCHNCRPHCSISTGETELFTFLSSIADTVQSDRDTIAPFEIDCFIKEYSIGIEYCGIYYHSDKFKDNNYHLDKLIKANKNNIDLVQVFDDEWNDKKDIVKSILANRLGKTSRKLHGRKTTIKLVNSSIAKQFLDDNHIQGFVAAPIRIGLYYGDELVMLATFSANRASVGALDKGWYELVRLCSKQGTIILGGFSKLLKYFKENYQPIGIKTYCDKRFFNGKGYEAVGFVRSHDTVPSYYYSKSGNRFSRYLFQKHKLAGKLKVYDAKLSERDNMIANNYHRVFDCGLIVYRLAF